MKRARAAKEDFIVSASVERRRLEEEVARSHDGFIFVVASRKQI